MMLVLGLSIYKVVELLAMFEVLAGLITKPQAALSIWITFSISNFTSGTRTTVQCYAFVIRTFWKMNMECPQKAELRKKLCLPDSTQQEAFYFFCKCRFWSHARAQLHNWVFIAGHYQSLWKSTSELGLATAPLPSSVLSSNFFVQKSHCHFCKAVAVGSNKHAVVWFMLWNA